MQVWEDDDDVIIFVEPHPNPLYIPSDTEADFYHDHIKNIYGYYIVARTNSKEIMNMKVMLLDPRQLGTYNN